MPTKRYKVSLSGEEWAELTGLVSKGKGAAGKLTHARILLMVDEGASGPGWTDQQIVDGWNKILLAIEDAKRLWLDLALERNPPIPEPAGIVER